MGAPRMATASQSSSVGHTAAGPPTLHLKVGPPAPHANASQPISDMLPVGLPVRAALLALSNDVPVSVPSESNGRPSAPHEAASVLSNLPRTRPQRSTPRRTAARKALTTEATQTTPAVSNARTATPRTRAKAPAAAVAAKPRKATPTRKATAKPRVRSAPERAPKAAPELEPVPLQGFESENDRARGPVHPPGGAELVASAIEVVGELAKSGLSTGERLLKDVLSRLPLS